MAHARWCGTGPQGSRTTSRTESETFTYDAFGHLLSRTQGASAEQFVWNYAGDTPTLASINPGPPSIRYFIDTPDGLPLESIDGASGARRFYHYDENGNTMFLTDDTGAAVAEYAYGPYGEVTSSGLTADNPFTFGAANGMFQLGASGLFADDSDVYDAITKRVVSWILRAERAEQPGVDDDLGLCAHSRVRRDLGTRAESCVRLRPRRRSFRTDGRRFGGNFGQRRARQWREFR